jgi:DNA polymerase-1
MKKIALIDADSLMYYEMGKETLEEAMMGIDSRINTILDETGADEYMGFLTLGKCFRYKIAKTKNYKYNRSGAMKPPIFYALRAYLQQEPYNFYAVEGLEADDCVSVYSQVIAELPDFLPVVCSPDKDVLKQVPGKHLNFQKMEWINTSKIAAEAFLWKQTLMGDSTDGIPGIPGLGPKTADKLIDTMPDILEYSGVVLEKYIEKFGNKDGICRFAETFNLVYLLRTPEEVLTYTGSSLPELKLNLSTLNMVENESEI